MRSADPPFRWIHAVSTRSAAARSNLLLQVLFAIVLAVIAGGAIGPVGMTTPPAGRAPTPTTFGPGIRTVDRLQMAAKVIEGTPCSALALGWAAATPLASQFFAAEAVPELEGAASQGTRVFRVWGRDASNPDLAANQSGPWGRSWTRVDPRTVPNYRNAAGLPNDANLGRFMSVGRLADTTDVVTTTASRIGENVGGLDEVFIPNPEQQVILEEVMGLNPEF